MKRIIIAPDSFKESLESPRVAAAVAAGIKRVYPACVTVEVPMSDGGEGLVRSLMTALQGKVCQQTVTGPLGEPVEAFWGISGDGRTGVVEMAAASGLSLVPPSRRNPWKTTSYGTGELIQAALDAGCRRIIIGIGGSATNDGGAGMARALGAKLEDEKGKEIAPGAEGLLDLDRIDISGFDPRLRETEFIAAVDVDNPLCGPRGAAYVYGSQKGAESESLEALDKALYRYAAVLYGDCGLDIIDLPGAGAAGGMGGGLAVFFNAQLKPGIEVVLEAVDLEGILREGADLVITAEGEINGQTAYGKVPVGVARVAKKFGLPVVAFAGSIGEDAAVVLNHGIDAYFSLPPRPVTLRESMERGEEFLTDLAEQCFRLLRAAGFCANE